MTAGRGFAADTPATVRSPLDSLPSSHGVGDRLNEVLVIGAFVGTRDQRSLAMRFGGERLSTDIGHPRPAVAVGLLSHPPIGNR